MANQDSLLHRDKRPLYEQAQSAIIELIESGELEIGGKLPPEDELAASLGVSRTTIRTTLGNLEVLGYIRRVQGAGTFIAEKKRVVVNPLDTIQALHPHLTARAGLSSRLDDVQIQEIPADSQIASHFGLSEGEPVTKISRTVVVENTPIGHLIDYLPKTIVTVEELETSFQDSVIDYFDGQRDKPLIDWSRVEVSAVRADETVSRLLDLSPGSIVFLLDELYFTEDGTLISWALNYFCPDCMRLRVEQRKVVRDQ